MSRFHAVQAFMKSQQIDGWLVADFRNSNAVLSRVLDAGGTKLHLTRRVYWLLPCEGEPMTLCSAIDHATFAALKHPVKTYVSWGQLHEKLRGMLASLPGRRLAMEYSAGCSLPTIGIVDAGTIELVRAMGHEVVSSADLVQAFAGVWGEVGLSAHREASTATTRIMREAWAYLQARLKAGDGSANEYSVQQFITKSFVEAGLAFLDEAIVSVNANAADPHYGPSKTQSSPIRKGDWVLIDMWARPAKSGDLGVYSDITWTGYCGPQVPSKAREVFDLVKRARDASLAAAVRAWQERSTVEGWQLDDAGRVLLEASEHRAGIKHRTGHSLSPGAMVHGIGMNLDNLETHDTRRMLAGTGFTIEPGLYLPRLEWGGGGVGIGVRNEINVYVDAVKGPVVTSCVQDEPVGMEV
jgi:Xaa-Pro dipeptidase